MSRARDWRLGGVPAERTLSPGIRRKLCVGWPPQHGQCSCRDNPAPRAAVCPPKQGKLRTLAAAASTVRTSPSQSVSISHSSPRRPQCANFSSSRNRGPRSSPRSQAPYAPDRAPPSAGTPRRPTSDAELPSNAGQAITHPLDAPFSRLDRPWHPSPAPQPRARSPAPQPRAPARDHRHRRTSDTQRQPPSNTVRPRAYLFARCHR